MPQFMFRGLLYVRAHLVPAVVELQRDIPMSHG